MKIVASRVPFAFLALAVLASLSTTPSPAQNSTGPAPLPLALRDAVAQAVQNNLDIAVARLDPQLAQQDVVAADAAFDPTFDTSASFQKSKDEPSSVFAATSTDTISAQAGYNDPLRFGGTWGATFDYRDSKSDYPSAARQFGLFDRPISASVTLNYSQSLLRNFGLEINRTAIDQAINAQKISEEELRIRVLDTVQAVETGYWNLVGARRQLEVANASLDLAKDFLRQTKIKVDVGTLPPIEITTADAEVASREEGVIVSENAVRNAEDQLRALLRVPKDSLDWNRPIEPTDQPGFSPIPVNLEDAIRTALERRGEIAQAELSVRNAELNERYRTNQVRPDLRVQASYTMTGNNFDYSPQSDSSTTTPLVPCPDDPTQVCFGTPITITSTDLVRVPQSRGKAFSEIPSRDNDNWFVGGTFVLPIGNRAAKAEQARARVAVEQANLRVEAVRQAVRVEVRDAVRSLDTAARRVATTRANVVLQRKKLEAEQKRYENGLSTAFQVLTFQTDLRDAESREITAIVDYNRAVAALGRSQGTLLEQRGITLGGQ